MDLTLQQRLAVARRLNVLAWTATRSELEAVAPRSVINELVAQGEVVRLRRGCYITPQDDPARLAALRLGGVAAYRSAARHWAWPMKWLPERPSVVVRRGRDLTPAQRDGVDVSWRSLAASEVVDGWVTSPLRTVLDCAARLPFDEALAIADSALRSRLVTPAELRAAAAASPRRGHARVCRVAAAADPRAANPFESVLRAIASDVRGLSLTPQVRIERGGRFVGIVDLADESLRIVVEADSLEHHGDRISFERDCRRYDELVADGWVVLRFSWDHVMTKPDWVREIIAAVVVQRQSLVG